MHSKMLPNYFLSNDFPYHIQLTWRCMVTVKRRSYTSLSINARQVYMPPGPTLKMLPFANTVYLRIPYDS